VSLEGMKKVLKNRNFLKLWIGQIVSNIGDEVAFFGLGVLVVFSWHGSATDLSIVMASSLLPILIFGPFAGIFVDRWNKKYTMIAADLIRSVLAIFFIFCTSIIQLSIVVFLLATVSRFFYPARVSIIPEIMKDKNLVEANSFSQMTYMLSIIMGPIIATPMIYFLGYIWIFVFDSVSYIFSATMISTLIYKAKAKKERKKPFVELAEGLRYIKEHQPVKVLLLIFTVVMLLVGGLNVAFSIYIRDIIHMGVNGYGALEILFGIGTVVGSVSVGALAGRFSSAKMVITGILGVGAMILILGIAPSLIIALICGGFMIGYFVGYITAPATAIFQKSIKKEFRGRVFSVQGAIIQGATLVSIVIIGLLVDHIGIIHVILISSSILIAFSAYLFLSKAIKILSSVGE
jgi:DHA3 family macrolide efflux protein-like MFS transporter